MLKLPTGFRSFAKLFASWGNFVEAARRVFPAAPEGTRKIIATWSHFSWSFLAYSSHFLDVCVEIMMRPEHSNLTHVSVIERNSVTLCASLGAGREAVRSLVILQVLSFDSVPGGHQHRRDLLDH